VSRMPEQLTGVPLQFTIRSGVPQGAGGYALKRIEHLLTKTPGHLLHVAVTLSMDHNPANVRPAGIEIAVDVNGMPVRVHVAAATPGEAADLAVDRLQRRLVLLRERQRTRHRAIRRAVEQQGRQADTKAAAEDQLVIRRRAFAPEPITPEEAAYRMELLDYDFYLFTDVATGADSAVSRLPDGDFEVDDRPPTLTTAEAKERLRAGGERFVFYRDKEAGRGRVLYRRYDGSFGLIAPS